MNDSISIISSWWTEMVEISRKGANEETVVQHEPQRASNDNWWDGEDRGSTCTGYVVSRNKVYVLRVTMLLSYGALARRTVWIFATNTMEMVNEPANTLNRYSIRLQRKPVNIGKISESISSSNIILEYDPLFTNWLIRWEIEKEMKIFLFPLGVLNSSRIFRNF